MEAKTMMDNWEAEENAHLRKILRDSFERGTQQERVRVLQEFDAVYKTLSLDCPDLVLRALRKLRTCIAITIEIRFEPKVSDLSELIARHGTLGFNEEKTKV